MMTLSAFLEAPCRWCGYNGQLYWQAGSHYPNCPWHKIGGGYEREEQLINSPDMLVHNRENLHGNNKRMAK